MQYSWKGRGDYARYKANEILDTYEKQAGERLPDDMRAALFNAYDSGIRDVILDIVEEFYEKK